MKVPLQITVIAFLVSLTFGFATTPDEYRQNVQTLMDDYTAKYNTAFQMAVVHESLNMTLVSGIQDFATGAKMTVDDKIPEGSVTKSYTVMAILRLID